MSVMPPSRRSFIPNSGLTTRSSVLPLWTLPACCWLIFFIALPLIFIFLLSLGHRDASGGIRWGFELSNYARLFDRLYFVIYARSVWLAALTTSLCLVLSFPVAIFIARQQSTKVKNLLMFLVTLPFWTSFLVRTYAWIILLRSEGLINNTLSALGVIQQPLPLLYTPFAVLVGLVYGELPFMILPLYTALEKIDASLVEASADLGCSNWQTFFRVLLPLSRPGIVAGVILVFVPSLGAFITPDLLGGARSMMVGSLIQNQFAVVRDQPFGSAIAFLLTVLVLILLALSYRPVRESAEARVL
jgi:spermidine/putrescine transport system permease protein